MIRDMMASLQRFYFNGQVFPHWTVAETMRNAAYVSFWVDPYTGKDMRPVR